MNDRKAQALDALSDVGVVAVYRSTEPADWLDIARAVRAGGLKHLEITMTTPGALDILRELRAAEPDLFIGMGTVLDAMTARLAILAGADYVVSPCFDAATVDLCREYDVAVMAGAMTPTEVANAWNAGSDVVKVFPGRIATPDYIRDLRAPLPHIKMMPTAEMTLETVRDYIRAGVVAIGVGSILLDPEAMRAGRWDVITSKAQQYRCAVTEARSA
jgi:2-dehydro-3-deoxyphosphogluconate aldolase / (4S)-4-hydroxy-2-oxoglutarate aldolase